MPPNHPRETLLQHKLLKVISKTLDMIKKIPDDKYAALVGYFERMKEKQEMKGFLFVERFLKKG